MPYDFYDPSWYRYTNSHSMLYDSTSQVSGRGLGAKKLALGMPFYWYAWRLANANNHGMLAPSTGPAAPDGCAMGYNQIKNFIASNSGTVVVYDSTIVTK